MLYAVLGLFNSTLANWWFVKRYGLLMEVAGFKVSMMPLPDHWHARWEELAATTNSCISLHKRLPLARTEQDKTLVQRQIAATDKEIDRLVYDLYGLTDDEIAIVEGSQ
jgi:hypothetical protein